MSCAVYIMGFGLGEPTRLAQSCLALSLSTCPSQASSQTMRMNLLSHWCLTLNSVSETDHCSVVYMRGWLATTDIDCTWISLEFVKCVLLKKKKCLQIFAHGILHCSFPVECVCGVNIVDPFKRPWNSSEQRGQYWAGLRYLGALEEPEPGLEWPVL